MLPKRIGWHRRGALVSTMCRLAHAVGPVLRVSMKELAEVDNNMVECVRLTTMAANVT